MNARFTDKVVLITGGGTGIGRATASGVRPRGRRSFSVSR